MFTNVLSYVVYWSSAVGLLKINRQLLYLDIQKAFMATLEIAYIKNISYLTDYLMCGFGRWLASVAFLYFVLEAGLQSAPRSAP